MDHIDVPDGAALGADLQAFLDEVGSLQFADVDVPEPVACDDEDSYLKTATGPGERAFIQDEVLDGSNPAQAVLVERLQRTRARNRAAQARYRDKIKACAPHALSPLLKHADMMLCIIVHHAWLERRGLFRSDDPATITQAMLSFCTCDCRTWC